MPTINLKNIIDEMHQHQSQPPRHQQSPSPSNLNPIGYHLPQSSIQSSTMQQPLLQFKPINIVAQQNANYNYEQQQEELFMQQNNSATINNYQQHLQSMPLLNADLLITPKSKPPVILRFFKETQIIRRQEISGSYGSRSFSFPPHGVDNNFANLKKTSNSTTQYRQLSLYSTSTTIPMHSLNDHLNRTPPFNPPTPVDLPMVPTVHPSTSQYHSLVGNNGNSSNSIIGYIFAILRSSLVDLYETLVGRMKAEDSD
ncbi:896_t:CDS:2 [Ambispora leptoticha]|uniref:896_t:CDS:1 n=1 Tax=Ambispora leptoticha TaxID=144679 RepID=A0A9N9G964_9GLOM|nr:896_t:CDS:2 [Ambispora leptoticha]